MKFALGLLLLTSITQAYANTIYNLDYEISSTQNGTAIGIPQKEKIVIFPNGQIWIEIKKDKFYVDLMNGAFYFVNLSTGTRHEILRSKSRQNQLKNFNHGNCKVHFDYFVNQSTQKSRHEFCMIDSKISPLPHSVYVWLMDPTFPEVIGLDDSINSLVPHQITSAVGKGLEIKRVLLKQAPNSEFIDDLNEIRKLPLGKPCSNRYCGQLI